MKVLKSYQGSEKGQGQGPGEEGKAEVNCAYPVQLGRTAATLGASLVKTHKGGGNSMGPPQGICKDFRGHPQAKFALKTLNQKIWMMFQMRKATMSEK